MVPVINLVIRFQQDAEDSTYLGFHPVFAAWGFDQDYQANVSSMSPI